MSPVIVPASDAHAVAMAPRMRNEDALEVVRGELLTPLEAIRQSMRLSSSSWTWLHEGRPGCMFGVAEGVPARPWLLGTPDVVDNPLLFWRHSRRIAALMHEVYPILEGYCDARYTVALRWLERLGFELQPVEPLGPIGAPFYRYRTRP